MHPWTVVLSLSVVVRPTLHPLPCRVRARPLACAAGTTAHTFEFGGFTCAYRVKPAAPGAEAEPPLLLVHPVGIGLSSWFFDQLLDAVVRGAPVQAVPKHPSDFARRAIVAVC